MNWIIAQEILCILLLIGLAIPLGLYINRVMMGEKVFLSPIIVPIEKWIARMLGVSRTEEMSSKKYAYSALSLGIVGLIVVFLLQLIQKLLPGNPQGLASPSLDLAFNTAASYVSNTNWQAYAGETTLSYTVQAIALTVQNFVSGAMGLCVLYAFIRGFIRREQKTIGSFWADMIRSVLYILLPLSLIVAFLLVSQGVVQSFRPTQTINMLETGAQQQIPLGPAASQVAIKQLGSNGGGFFGANSAFPLENPTIFSNIVQVLSILLIPVACVVAFGKAIGNKKQGFAILTTMFVLFFAALAVITISETKLAPQFASVAAAGNLEGKEMIHGIGASSFWAASTTAVSNGAINANLDSFTPLSGIALIFQMQLGEIIFGGMGSGLYGMLAFVLLAVFIAGLMVGRTPEYLGKKLDPYDMRMTCLIILTPAVLALLGTSITVLLPQAVTWTRNIGAHKFSEILYAFTSMANNNGSAFAGFTANTTFTNIVGGIIMLVSRFVPMIAVILMAGNLAQKKTVASGEGSLSTSKPLFVGLLLMIIILIGALSFLPSLSLGPIADFFATK